MDRIRVDLDALDMLIYHLRGLLSDMEVLEGELYHLHRNLNDRNGQERKASWALHRATSRMEELIGGIERLIYRLRYACEVWENCEAANMARAEEVTAELLPEELLGHQDVLSPYAGW